MSGHLSVITVASAAEVDLPAIFLDELGETFHVLKRFPCRFRIGNGHAEVFFDCDRKFEGVDGIQSQPLRTEQLGGGSDFLGRNFEHQMLDHDLADLCLKFWVAHED